MKTLESRNQSRLYQINVRVSGEELTAIQEGAERLGVPVSQLLREGGLREIRRLDKKHSR